MLNQTPFRFTESEEIVAPRRMVRRGTCNGHSLIEMLIVLALIGVVTSIALPQMIVQRRLSRSIGITRDILTQLRLARQLAMSQRQAFTFQYDDLNKRISIIDHNANTGGLMLTDPSYPNTAGSQIVSVNPLADVGLSSEMAYGIPSTLPVGALPSGKLDDKTAMTPLFNSQVNITFQPDGSVIKASGDPEDHAIFIYNSRAANGTASAISILGAAGRVKIWRYNEVANRYAE